MSHDIAKIDSIAQAGLDAAAEIAVDHFRKNFSSSIKSDRSPLTAVDLMIERSLKDFLSKKFIASGFFCEESGISDSDKEFVWCIDPIDGTRSFLSGYPIFCILLALYYQQEPIWAAIESPLTNERWVAFDQKTLFCGVDTKVSNMKKVEDSLLAATSPLMFDDHEYDSFQRLLAKVKSARFGGDAYNYGTLASGHLDLVVESDLKFHDIAALIPIVENAGGAISDWQGGEIEFGYNGAIVAAASQELLLDSLKILNRD